MPTARLIERSEVRRATRRRAGEHVRREREEARTLLRQARTSSKVIELTLGEDERDETIKSRYRIVAREEGVKVRFQTGAQRTYRNRKGREEYEASVMIVQVVDS